MTESADSYGPVTTSGERWLRMVTALAAREGVELTVAGMCTACAEVLAVFGTGIVLMASDTVTGALYSSNGQVGALQDLEGTLGVGPGADAYRRGVTVIEDDLVAGPPGGWSGLVDLMIQVGVAAVWSFPLQVGAVRIGSLSVYRDQPGPNDHERFADATVMAGVVTRAILGIQAGSIDGVLAAGLADGQAAHADQVHQASGMVSVQLDIGVGEALARLRARAFRDETTVGLVAVEIVARRMRLES